MAQPSNFRFYVPTHPGARGMLQDFVAPQGQNDAFDGTPVSFQSMFQRGYNMMALGPWFGAERSNAASTVGLHQFLISGTPVTVYGDYGLNITPANLINNYVTISGTPSIPAAWRTTFPNEKLRIWGRIRFRFLQLDAAFFPSILFGVGTAGSSDPIGTSPSEFFGFNTDVGATPKTYLARVTQGGTSVDVDGPDIPVTADAKRVIDLGFNAVINSNASSNLSSLTFYMADSSVAGKTVAVATSAQLAKLNAMVAQLKSYFQIKNVLGGTGTNQIAITGAWVGCNLW